MLTKDFTLNKTEFIAYLQCPFQFYLLKELSAKTTTDIRLSDYEPFLQAGLEKHLWFQHFYKRYGSVITTSSTPSLNDFDCSAWWKRTFFTFECDRYLQDPTFWAPVAVEYSLSSDCYFGKIDRIDLLNVQGHCRVVDYKSSPKPFDEEELLFYALLLTDTLPCSDFPTLTQITEIGLYYYSTGEFFTAKITPSVLDLFRDYLWSIRQEMLSRLSVKKSITCDSSLTSCLYRDLCQRISL